MEYAAGDFISFKAQQDGKTYEAAMLAREGNTYLVWPLWPAKRRVLYIRVDNPDIKPVERKTVYAFARDFTTMGVLTRYLKETTGARKVVRITRRECIHGLNRGEPIYSFLPHGNDLIDTARAWGYTVIELTSKEVFDHAEGLGKH